MSSFSEYTSSTDLLIVMVIICVGLSSFALGRLSVTHESQTPVSIETVTMPSPTGNIRGVVASKNSTKYHYPWCSGAKRINDENMITFKNVAVAGAAGYEPAKNCPGLPE